MLLCVAIVVIVSPSCERTAPKRLSSLTVSLHANALASAVMDAVNSHGFIEISPLILFYAYYRMQCEANLLSAAIQNTTNTVFTVTFKVKAINNHF